MEHPAAPRLPAPTVEWVRVPEAVMALGPELESAGAPVSELAPGAAPALALVARPVRESELARGAALAPALVLSAARASESAQLGSLAQVECAAAAVSSQGPWPACLTRRTGRGVDRFPWK